MRKPRGMPSTSFTYPVTLWVISYAGELSLLVVCVVNISSDIETSAAVFQQIVDTLWVGKKLRLLILLIAFLKTHVFMESNRSLRLMWIALVLGMMEFNLSTEGARLRKPTPISSTSWQRQVFGSRFNERFIIISGSQK